MLSFSAVAEKPALLRVPATVQSTPPLAMLLSELAASNYRFTTPTPLTHQRALAHRNGRTAASLRDIFGWSLPFQAEAVRPDLLALMDDAGVLLSDGLMFSSSVRVSTIDDDFFLHSAYPSIAENAVFFGPDTYRFGRLIAQGIAQMSRWRERCGYVFSSKPLRVLDVGCGTGAGGIVAARCLKARGRALSLTMNDINPLALQYTAVNAAFAGIPVALAQGDALSAVSGEFDLVISNPPYLDDAAGRSYRHGGARLGRALGISIATQALDRLAPGGQLLLYTGVAIVAGVDPFIAEVLPFLERAGCEWSYSEIDPDIFGEELEQPVYAHVDRIAAVGLMARRTAVRT